MLHIYNKEDQLKILVQNSCNKKDIDKIRESIDHYDKIDISFMDCEFVDKDLIDVIYKNRYKIDLNTNNKTLWIYLKRLKFDMQLSYKIDTAKPNNLKAIAIGGSAGSLQNIIKIIDKLPYANISVFIVMHVLPNEPSRIVNILQQYTNYKVNESLDSQKIEPYNIYIAKPDYHMVIENGYIYNSKSKPVNFCRPAIDALFQSAAHEFKNSLLAILTCGYMDDGSRALKDIKENFGISIVQNPNECEANEMPLNAIITKNNDCILNIDEISDYIDERLNFTIDLDKRIDSFVKHVDDVYGYDFSHYDSGSLKRRVELLKNELQLDNFSQFEYMILHDDEMFELLFKKLSINVSEFFRDIDMFNYFKDILIPILETYPHIKIWCSACAKGQEPYSIAMLLDSFGLLNRSIIYATDFNELILKQAKNGLYSNDEFELCKRNFKSLNLDLPLENWFDIKDDYVEIKEYIRDKVQFFQHNLVTDGVINEFNIVFCRNVLIYFDKELQDKVTKLMYDSLIRSGFLVLGNSERTQENKLFVKQRTNSNAKVYKKRIIYD